MSDKSSIEWTDATWNPVRGCTKVSPGCKHCYAETFAERWRGVKGHAYEQGFDLRLVPDKLDEPLRRKKPTTYFVNSMSDLFQEGVPDEFIDQVFAVMALAPQHTFQVLTKRADRMRTYFSDAEHRQGEWAGALHKYLIGPGGNTHEGVERWCKAHGMTREERERRLGIVNNGGGWHFFRQNWPLLNVWLGVSVENQHFADERIPLLLQTPAAVRFISAEPLLGPINLTEVRTADWMINALTGEEHYAGSFRRGIYPKLDWVIVGGESGHGARPFDLAWARSIVAQCKAAGVPVFVKQLGASPVIVCPVCHGLGSGDTKLDTFCGRCMGCHRQSVLTTSGKGGDPAEWPEDLRVRQFPAIVGLPT